MLEKTLRPPCLFDKLQLLFIKQKPSNFFTPIKRQCERTSSRQQVSILIEIFPSPFFFFFLHAFHCNIIPYLGNNDTLCIMIFLLLLLFFLIKINKSIERKEIGLSIVPDYLLINK